MISKELFSSTNQNWTTPQPLFDRLNNVFHFNIDLAADVDNTKCFKYFSEDNSALNQEWILNTSIGQIPLIGYCNPPFKCQDLFIKKAASELTNSNATSVFLIPSRTDTRRWQEFVFPLAKYILFLKHRIKFSGNKDSAPFPSALAIFTNYDYNLESLNDLGFQIR